MKLKTLNNTQLCPQHQESYNTLPWFNTLDHTRKVSFRTREEPGETIQNTVIYSAAKKKTDRYLSASIKYLPEYSRFYTSAALRQMCKCIFCVHTIIKLGRLL